MTKAQSDKSCSAYFSYSEGSLPVMKSISNSFDENISSINFGPK